MAVAEAPQQVDIPEGTQSGEDPDAGQLFEVPRVKIEIDETDPTVIKLGFGGSIELDRSVASDVQVYNSLVAGRNASLHVEVFVKGPKNTHRRDSEGNVDAVVQTKSLDVHSIDVDG